MADELPPIREWWSHLAADAKEFLLEYPAAPLVGTVRQEVTNASGVLVEDGTRLSDDDVQFLRSEAGTAV